MTEPRPIDEPADRGEPIDAACIPWVEMMAAAEEGTLQPDQAAAFVGHIETCSQCAALFQAAHAGSQWIALVDRRPPVPDGLLESILAQTGPGSVNAPHNRLAAAAGVQDLMETASRQTSTGGESRAGYPVSAAIIAAQASARSRPAYARILLTAAMAIFSIALTLNLAADRLPQKPDRSAVTTQLRATGGLVAGYYAGFSKAQIRMIDQIRSAFEDLRQPTQNKIANPLDPSL